MESVGPLDAVGIVVRSIDNPPPPPVVGIRNCLDVIRV